MHDSLKRYLKRSREPYTAALLVLPLFVIYQIGILSTGGLRNGADFMTDLLFLASGYDWTTYLIINAGMLAVFVVAVLVLRKKGKFQLRVWPWVVLESTVYAMFLGSAVITLMRNLQLDQLPFSAGGLPMDLWDAFILSLGAGIYEETVFRVALMGGLFLLGTRALRWSKWVSAVAAVIVSSLAFSWVHHIGPLGEDFVFQAFAFRFLAGALLAIIYHLRGFAVVVYTHAIYDILVMVVPG